MTYTLNMPTASQSLGVTQPLIATNFQLIDSTLNVDHYSMTAGSTIGNHRKVKLITAAAPSSGSGAAVTLYSKDVGGRSTVFYKKDGSSTEIQLTNDNPSIGATSLNTFLPGGIRIIAGKATIASSAGQNIPFGFTFSSAPYVVASVINETGSTRTVQIGTISTTQVFIRIRDPGSGGTTGDICYYVIGPYS